MTPILHRLLAKQLNCTFSKALIRLFCALNILIPAIGLATIAVDGPFANGMVLPKNTTIQMGFYSDSERSVTVSSSLGTTRTYRATRGRMFFELKTKGAGGPKSITITDGQTSKTISDIYVGQVILLTGQSNAEMPMYLPSSGYPQIPAGGAEFADAHDPQIRFCRIRQTNSTTLKISPPDPCVWEKGDGSERGRFSAICWRAAKILHRNTGEAVGVLSITFGGTAIERWIPYTLLNTLPFGEQQYRYPENVLWCQAYNAMVYPFRNFVVDTIIWYQGEGNVWSSNTYDQRLPAYLGYLQSEFSSKNRIPKMYCVEIAPYTGYTNLGSPYIRMEHSQHSNAHGWHFISTSDLTNDIGNVHPVDKFPVGDRIGQKLLDDYNGVPMETQFMVTGQTISGDVVTLNCQGAGSGISLARPDGFSIITAQGSRVEAHALALGSSILVWADGVSNPVAARYGWANDFKTSAFNSEGLPLGSYAGDGIR